MRKLVCLLILLNTLVAKAQGRATTDTIRFEGLKFYVQEASEWTQLLNRQSGWFGADGIYSIPLNGKEHRQVSKTDKTLFIFSDTMVGEIKKGELQPGFTMVHNSAAVLTGNHPVKSNLNFYWKKDTKHQPLSLFVPHTPQTEPADYFWLGDGFVNLDQKGALYLFGYRVHNVSEDAFGFREVGNVLIKLNKNHVPRFTKQRQEDTPFYLSGKNIEVGSFGAAIYVNTKSSGAVDPDGYIYVYGVQGMAKKLLVARVEANAFDNFSQWRFWDGNNWVADIREGKEITHSVSNEMSVSRLPDGRYALIFQVGGMTPYIGMRIGKSLTGPFSDVIHIWDCNPDLLKPSYLVYNAKAHPALSKPGELLISYNINSAEFIKDLKSYPNLYRPRFIKLRFLND
ncbi:DUF4185 domain-containing protein [Mucilaginibacter sp. CSA2-8R]|uniref:DUF4185 domain-containing protein n=1 Tax=Mucilaginibacter sp. CSA2-8R TaxID=3141542 RepID=UPI00315DF6FA